MKKKVIIFGYSGHAFVAIEIASLMRVEIEGYVLNHQETNNPFDLKYLGTDEEIIKITNREELVSFIAIGNNQVRKRVFEKMTGIFPPITLKHPNAILSPYANVDVGSMIGAGAILNTFSKVGKACIINTGAIIEHDCVVEDFSHIAPGAVLAGNVTVGPLSFVGANAVIKQGVTIGSNVTIGAGAVILNDVHDNVVIAGNPGKILRHKTC